jgi:hypothetical protein
MEMLMLNRQSFTGLLAVARAPHAGEDFGGLAAKFQKPPANAGVVKANGFFRLSEAAFPWDFAGDVDPARSRALCAVQGRGADMQTKRMGGATAIAVKASHVSLVSHADVITGPILQAAQR